MVTGYIERADTGSSPLARVDGRVPPGYLWQRPSSEELQPACTREAIRKYETLTVFNTFASNVLEDFYKWSIRR